MLHVMHFSVLFFSPLFFPSFFPPKWISRGGRRAPSSCFSKTKAVQNNSHFICMLCLIKCPAHGCAICFYSRGSHSPIVLHLPFFLFPFVAPFPHARIQKKRNCIFVFSLSGLPYCDNFFTDSLRTLHMCATAKGTTTLRLFISKMVFT